MSTSWFGKIVGFCVGYLFFREIGAVLGLMIGHYMDLHRVTHPAISAQQRLFIQQAYFKATFLIMGHLAKADGVVSKDEIRAARTIMQSMNLNESQKREAIHLFNQGKQRNFNLNRALDDLYNVCGNQPMLYRMFIDIQFRAATADGAIGPNKRNILNMICSRFNLNYHEFAVFYEHYQYQGHRQHRQSESYHERARQQYQGQERTQRTAQPHRNTELDNAYNLLGVNTSNSDDEVKKRYRKLMSQNHPDKLISKGLPEEMIKLATQKTQEIKGAYDIIKKSRGMK